MRLLAFDQSSTAIGWCYGSDDDGVKPVHGVYGPGQYGDADELLANDVYKFVKRKIEEAQPDAVYLEQVFPGPFTAKLYLVMCTIIVTCGAREKPLPVYAAQSGEWRMHFLGRRNAPNHAVGAKHEKNSNRNVLKEMAELRCLELNWPTSCHDEAEACGIWDYGMNNISRKYRDRIKVERQTRHAKEIRQDLEVWR